MIKNLIRFACIFVLILASCSSEDVNLSYQVKDTYPTDCLSESEAMALAENMYQLHYPNHPQSRSSQVANVQVIRGKGARNSRDSLIYVVNFMNDGGYALVAVPRIASPLIAVVESGNYNLEDPVDNPGFLEYMERAEDYVATAPLSIRDSIRIPVRPPGRPVESKFEKTDTTIVEIGADFTPLIKVRWGQNYPENLYAPYRRPAGCVNTAVAQLMSYYRPTQFITYDFPEAEKAGEVLNWDKLNKIAVSAYTNDELCKRCSADVETHKMLGRLCRQIGHFANSNYTDTVTWTYVSRIPSILSQFLPNAQIGEWTTYTPDIAMSYLDHGPIFMNGNGHAWVADDYYYKKTTYTDYIWNGITRKWEYWSSYDEIINTVHFNWGVNGRYDGYFSATVLSPWDNYTAKNMKFIPITIPFEQ